MHLNDECCCRLAQQAWQDKHGTWTASPLRGHINFCCSSLPDSVSVTSHDPTDAQPHATPADDLISKATQGNLAEPWTGQDLRLSLQAAIADKDLTATVQAASTQQPAGVSVHTATPAGTPAGSAAVPVIATAPGATAAVLSANKGAAVASVADNAATGAKRLQGPNAAVADPDTAPTTAAATPDGLKAGANISNANRDARHSSSGTAAAVNGGREGLDGSAVAQPTRVAAAASASNAESGSNTASGQARRLEIRLVPASLELIPVEFPLFKKYQMNNHGDKPGKVKLPLQ